MTTLTMHRREEPGFPPITRVTDRQMKELEKLVFSSRDAEELGKKLLVWMLRKSENLTRPVRMTLIDPAEGREGLMKSHVAAYAAHDMNSLNGSTHIDFILGAMGSPMCFSSHSGSYLNGELNPRAGGATTWLAIDHYDDSAEPIQPPTQEELDSILVQKY